MKTAVTVLQELMVKLGDCPEYECIAQSGPQHHATFEYRCTAMGVSVTGLARSKKEAKQEAARRMLMQLHARGLPVPPPYAAQPSPPPSAPPSPTADPALEAGPRAQAPDARTYVTLLKELCDEYRLGEPEYELVSDTGPAHQRRFTVRARLRLHERQVSSTTKKAARQLAAEALYSYLRENLARLTGDFVEEEALARAQERRAAEKRAAEGGAGGAGGAEDAARRYAELAQPAARPHLGLRLADYHLGLLSSIDKERVPQALAGAGAGAGAAEALGAACGALGLQVRASALAGLCVVAVEPVSPPLAFAGRTSDAAAGAALRYLRRALAAH